VTLDDALDRSGKTAGYVGIRPYCYLSKEAGCSY